MPPTGRKTTKEPNGATLGTMVDRVHRELTDADTGRIAGTCHAWRGDQDAGQYTDIPGFCKAAKLDAAIGANLKGLGYEE